MNVLLCLFLILTIIGGLNWGAHAMNYNLVELAVPAYANYVYYLVAVASLITLLGLMRGTIKCGSKEEKYTDLNEVVYGN